MKADAYFTEVENYAKWLCEQDGKDPDDGYTEYSKYYADEEDYFIPNWKDYELQAQRAVTYFMGECE